MNRAQKRKLERNLKKSRVSGLKVLDDGTLHAVRYIFHRQGEAPKSGIASEITFNQYASHTIRTETKSKIWDMWDDNFLHQDLSLCQAAAIIKKMDTVFKQIMKNEGYQSRAIRNTKSIGTEVYEIEGMDFNNTEDMGSIIDIIKSTWKIAYRIAYEFVTKTELDPKEWIGEEFEPRDGQDYLFIDPAFEFFKVNDKGTAESHGGTGKTKMSFRVAQLICKYVLKNGFKLLVISDSINNTVQQAVEFSKFYRGQTGKRLTKSYIIGSPSPNNFNILESWSTVISKKDPNLKNIIIDAVNSKEDCAFFVVNHSAEGFLNVAKRAKVNFHQFFTILDEIQMYASENDQPVLIDSEKCAALRYDDLFGKKFGLSATHIERNEELCDDRSAVFNNDLEKFGPKFIKIDEIKARELGWICDKQVLIADIPETEAFIQSMKENKPLALTYKNKTINIDPIYFVAVEALLDMALPLGKTHTILLTPFIKHIKALGDLFNYFKEVGIIDSDFEIIEGYANSGSSCVNRFNRSDKVIMIASRWVATGQDTYNCDCIIPLYKPDSESFKRQFSMRADRWKGDRSSLLIIVDFESNLTDNTWFHIAQNIANGEIPNIVSDAQIREFEEMDENTIDLSVGRNQTSDRHIDGGGLLVSAPHSNITLRVRRGARNRNPILQGSWLEIATMVATRTLTDKHGNSQFSKITAAAKTAKRANKFITKIINDIEDGKSMLAHIDGQRALYITNDPYIKLFAEKECVSFEEAANILSEELYRIDDYRNQENMKDYELFLS